MKKLLFFIACSLSLTLLTAEDVYVQRSVITSVGTTYPKFKSALCSVVSGKVQEVLVDVGTCVKQGQPLVILDPIFFRIDIAKQEASLSSARAALNDSKLNFERMKKLWNRTDGKAPSISHKRFEDAELQYEQDLAEEHMQQEALKKAQATLDESIVKAPYDGVITRRSVHPGGAVTAEQAIGLEIEYIDTLYIEFPISQTYYDRIHKGQEVCFEIDGVSQEKMTGVIDLLHPHIDDKTRSITCRASLDNKKHAIPSGSLVKVYVPLQGDKI